MGCVFIAENRLANYAGLKAAKTSVSKLNSYTAVSTEVVEKKRKAYATMSKGSLGNKFQ